MSSRRATAAIVLLGAALGYGALRAGTADPDPVSPAASSPAASPPNTPTDAPPDDTDDNSTSPAAPATTSRPVATSTRRPPPPPPAVPAPAAPHWTDPHDIARRWVTATCNYSWRDSYQRHAATQAAYTTPAFERILQQGAAADWQRNVVDPRMVGACRIEAAATIDAAPNTATTGYVRVSVVQALTPDGTSAAPASTSYPLRLALVAGRWLVDGYAVGG